MSQLDLTVPLYRFIRDLPPIDGDGEGRIRGSRNSRHVQLVYPKPNNTGEWGMGNREWGIFRLPCHMALPKVAHRVNSEFAKRVGGNGEYMFHRSRQSTMAK